jgi:hypothetical protein
VVPDEKEDGGAAMMQVTSKLVGHGFKAATGEESLFSL